MPHINRTRSIKDGLLDPRQAGHKAPSYLSSDWNVQWPTSEVVFLRNLRIRLRPGWIAHRELGLHVQRRLPYLPYARTVGAA